MDLSKYNNQELEQFTISTSIGILKSFRHSFITINECEKYLFNVDVNEYLRGRKVCSKVVNIHDQCVLMCNDSNCNEDMLIRIDNLETELLNLMNEYKYCLKERWV